MVIVSPAATVRTPGVLKWTTCANGESVPALLLRSTRADAAGRDDAIAEVPHLRDVDARATPEPRSMTTPSTLS
jgi:hypothetical protein